MRSRALLIQALHVLRPRYASTSSAATSSSSSIKAPSESNNRLRPILDHLPPSINWAVAYGSGVINQANASKSGVQPMTDFLISSSDPIEFHKDNLRINPSHYPFWARVAGEKTVAAVQEDYGAGIWYVTMVNIRGIEVKYGIISSSRLQRDLTNWETLYVAGRLHKPVLTLKSSPEIDLAQRTNLNSALSIALLVLPSTGFTEMELWEQIAGISYSGDPRMSVPGAENPDKVKNIVRGPGNLQGFRDLYGELMAVNEELRYEKEDGGEGGIGGERMMLQSDSLEYRTKLLTSLPMRVQQKLITAMLGSTISTNASQMIDSQIAGKILDHPDFRKVLLNQLRQIIHRPALTQSVKGLVTAGATKSVQYSLAKFRKWLAARGTKR